MLKKGPNSRTADVPDLTKLRAAPLANLFEPVLVNYGKAKGGKDNILMTSSFKPVSDGRGGVLPQD